MNAAPIEPPAPAAMAAWHKRLLGSAFLKNIATISLGQGFAALVPLLAAPILARLYDPSDYGYLAAYMAWAGIFGAVGNWQYAQGIIAVKRETTALALLKLCWITSLLTAGASIPIVILLMTQVGGVMDATWGKYWMLCLPATTFINGVSAALGALVNRENLYGKLAMIQLFPAPISVGLSLWMGWKGWGMHGLFASYLISQLTGFLLTLFIIKKAGKTLIGGTPWKRVAASWRKYKDFPIFTLPSSFIFVATSNAVVYTATPLLSIALLGSYGRANALLAMPLGLIGGSISQVFQRRAAMDCAQLGNCRAIFNKTVLLLAGAGGIPILIIGLFAPQLFAWFLGPKWHDAGRIAQILAPMLFLQIICNPVATVLLIRGMQKLAFKLTVYTSAFVWVCTLAALFWKGSIMDVITAFSFGFSVTYIIFFYYSWRAASGSAPNNNGGIS